MTETPPQSASGVVGDPSHTNDDPIRLTMDETGAEEMDEFESFRPALLKLDKDVRELEVSLLDGFGSRAEIIEWTQRLSVHTLGRVSQDWFTEMAKQFRSAYDDEYERTLVSCLLTGDTRVRPITGEQAGEVRRQMIAKTIRPAKREAFRELRKSAGEYIAEDSGSAEHNAARQRFIAMRPALDELHERQQEVLEHLIQPGGFADRDDLLAWTRDLELATHGEIPAGFGTRCYQERSTRRMLTGEGAGYDHAREFFAAAYLIPCFNAGVADLSNRSKENPEKERTEKSVVQM